MSMTTKKMSNMIAESLEAYGYQGRVQYVRDEIRIGFHLSHGVVMDLSFPADTAPVDAVKMAVGWLNKLNGK